MKENSPQIRPLKLGQDTVDLHHWLRKDYPDISEASEELPGIIEFINMELQGLVERRLNLKQAIKRRAAELFLALRDPETWEQSGYKGKSTEKALEMAVDMDEDREKLIREYSKITAWVGRLEGTLEAFQVKLDLVRTVEATKRKVTPGNDDHYERQPERSMRASRREIKDDTDDD